MKIFRFFPLLLFVFGCEENSSLFDIYKEIDFQKNIQSKNYKDFLKEVKENGISYADDPLTPNLSNGKIFGDKNITTDKVTRFFKYSPNSGLDHTASLFIQLDSSFAIYVADYYSEDARLEQIAQYKHFEVQKPIMVANKDGELQKRTPLPKELLPPKLPDLSIGIITPDLPDI
ncbi:hypothetical protein ThvES_00004420 [Thiovulum sp. ES]|nr:hypothetical protein ThvES_00004420 [Thiovulum sp. ES]